MYKPTNIVVIQPFRVLNDSKDVDDIELFKNRMRSLIEIIEASILC